jgi:cytochrome P450
MCQIATFIAAGHETTSSALTWCLFALSQSPSTQRKLRAALHTLPPPPSISSEEQLQPLTDAISRLPYLDWVVRESLRLHAPVTSTMRVCMREVDTIPVSDPFVDRKGTLRREIAINKGDIVTVPIQAVNKCKTLWGADAHIFRYVPLSATVGSFA